MRSSVVTLRLRKEFTRQIRTGRWAVGELIPPEMQLVKEYRASRTAVRSALKQIEAKGWLKSAQGSGRRVTASPGSGSWQATIGLLTLGTDLSKGQGGRFFAAFSAEVAALGHTLVTYGYNQPLADESPWHHARRMKMDNLDAAIVYAPQYHRYIDVLARRMPVISVPHDATEFAVPCFHIDYGFHAAVATRELARLGHRRIALLLSEPPPRGKLNSAIRRGYDLGRFFADLPLGEEFILGYPHTPDTSIYRNVLDRLLGLDPRPTAAIAYAGSPFFGMIPEAQARGIDLVREMSLVCLADLSVDEGMRPRIACFRIDPARIVRDAVRCLDAMLRDQPPAQTSHVYYGTFDPAETFGPPRT